MLYGYDLCSRPAPLLFLQNPCPVQRVGLIKPARPTSGTAPVCLVWFVRLVVGAAVDATIMFTRPARRSMYACMVRTICQYEIAICVVRRILVLVMHDFSRHQIAAYPGLYHKAMLLHEAIGLCIRMVRSAQPDIAVLVLVSPVTPMVVPCALHVVVTQETQRNVLHPVPTVVGVGRKQGWLAAAALAKLDELKTRWGRLRTHRNLLTVRCHSPAVDAARGFIVPNYSTRKG
jgi:hypothetical protein